MSVCLKCLRGLHSSCRGGCDCTHSLGPAVLVSAEETDRGEDERSVSNDKRERRTKPDHALKDQQSTGRKRAARLYPLDKEAICEWALLEGQGGGITIPGCGLRPGTVPGKQQARHHGPDYNTLNNEVGNVHRICHSCHNSWHAANDPHKDKRYLELYGDRAGGSNFKNSKVLHGEATNDDSDSEEVDRSDSGEVAE